VEFRNHTWMTADNQKETLDFLAARRLPYVCVDMPQGYPNSIPPLLAVTSDLAVVRMHGHSEKWESKDIRERFGYRYSDEELAQWAGNVQRLAGDAAETHVVFNNCYRDYAQANARQLADRLSPGTRAAELGGCPWSAISAFSCDDDAVAIVCWVTRHAGILRPSADSLRGWNSPGPPRVLLPCRCVCVPRA
jgi:hypothetical protein